MKIDLLKVKYDGNKNIDETIIINQSYYKDTSIRDLSEIRVIGDINYNEDDTYNLSLAISGKMTLPCNITLEDVVHPFTIEITEIINQYDKKNEDYVKIINNMLDIMPIIWQNIVVEIPLRVISPKAKNVKLEGNGWKLLNEEDIISELDPRLSKLKDLLDE